MSQSLCLDALTPVGGCESWPCDQRARVSTLNGQEAVAKDGGRSLCSKEEEPAADARNADVASMANFLIKWEGDQEKLHAWRLW